MGFPCALMPSAVKSVTPPPLSSYVRVTLCGGGPGSYVDCATLTCQVPILGSLSCADRLIIVLLLREIALPNRFAWLNDDCPTLLDAALHRFHLLKRLSLSRFPQGSGTCLIR